MSLRPAALLLAGLLVTLPAIGREATRAAETWEQRAEKQPVGAAAIEAPATKKGLADWIWGPSDDGEYRLTKSFTGGAKKVVITATADNRMTLLFNGREVAKSDLAARIMASPIAIGDELIIRTADDLRLYK